MSTLALVTHRTAGWCVIFGVGLLTTLLLCGLAYPVVAQDRPTAGSLADLSLEQLMDLEITSVSKKEERLFDAPAAVYVLTNEDIRRSGATSIPEALRMAPGLQVAQISSNQWAITARGFNNQFANKLLVLIDGRSVYTPLFSGVYWDVQDIMLEDIDRIEIIRGPGATLWGANAVNGVINIISKNAKDTQGILLSTGGGTEERGFGSLRYGGKFGDNLHYRVYAKYFARDTFFDPLVGHEGNDGWDMVQGGFRLDWNASQRDRVTVQGDIYGGQVGHTVTNTSLTPPLQRTFDAKVGVSGGNILGRWDRILSEYSTFHFQLYYDRTERQETVAGETRDTADVDFQHSFRLSDRQQITWGLGYRFTTDHVANSFTFSLLPPRRSQQLFSAFAQNEITLIPDRLRLTLGTKLEHNDHTGVEVQPSGRLLWTPHQQHTVWAAISRAVRTPSRIEDDADIDNAVFLDAEGLRNSATVFGNRHKKSEELLAHELGYRLQPSASIFLDVTAFYNVYNNLTTLEPQQPIFVTGTDEPPHVENIQQFANKAHGKTYGVETAATWNATSWWRVAAGYTWFDNRLRRDRSSQDTTVTTSQGNNPHHQFNFRSYINLPWRLEFDTLVYYVDNLPNLQIPSYVRLDLRLGWRVTENLELSVTGQNLSAPISELVVGLCGKPG